MSPPEKNAHACGGAVMPASAVVPASGGSAALELEGSPSALELEGSPSALELEGSPSALELEGSPSALELEGSPSALELEGCPSALELEATWAELDGASAELDSVVAALELVAGAELEVSALTPLDAMALLEDCGTALELDCSVEEPEPGSAALLELEAVLVPASDSSDCCSAPAQANVPLRARTTKANPCRPPIETV